MVSELMQNAEDIGVSRVSLNFAMFRSAFEQGAQLGAGPVHDCGGHCWCSSRSGGS